MRTGIRSLLIFMVFLGFVRPALGNHLPPPKPTLVQSLSEVDETVYMIVVPVICVSLAFLGAWLVRRWNHYPSDRV
jgi:hypothetical protein